MQAGSDFETWQGKIFRTRSHLHPIPTQPAVLRYIRIFSGGEAVGSFFWSPTTFQPQQSVRLELNLTSPPCFFGILRASLSFIHSSLICQTTDPKPLPKQFLHLMRSRASSFKWEYPLLSPRSSSSFLRLLSHLLVTSICPFIFPSITCFRRQMLCKMWQFITTIGGYYGTVI
jgi:hypothetical protein